MGADGLAVFMWSPAGIIFAALFIGVPIAVWSSKISRRFPQFGPWQPGGAYAIAGIGLAFFCFDSAYQNFSIQNAMGWLDEGQRWNIVPNWTGFLFLISLVLTLPALALILTPIVATFIMIRRMNLLSVTVTVAAL